MSEEKGKEAIVPEIVDAPITSLQEITKAEIDIQIVTAKRYPRSITKFRQDAETMAIGDAQIAASCFYKLKRKDKDGGFSFIEGPSVRLAEIVASAWGNLRFGARIVQENEKEVIAQGIAHDLEKNVCNIIEVSRRISTREGRRYSDDMISVTKNAACSIALRNAIFKTVPFTYAKQIYEKAKKVAVGDKKTLGERRQEILALFAQMNVSKNQILKFLEKPSTEEIGLAEIEILIGVFNAIKDGDTTVDIQFSTQKGKPAIAMPKALSDAAITEESPEDAPRNPLAIELENLAKDADTKTSESFSKWMGDLGASCIDDLKEEEMKAGIIYLKKQKAKK